MKLKEEEFKQNEESLTDLQLDEEQAQDAKGGGGHEKWIVIESLSSGTCRPGTGGSG